MTTKISSLGSLVGVWWEAPLCDWYLPPKETNFIFTIYANGTSTKVNLDEFIELVNIHPNSIFLVTGFEILLAYILWQKIPKKENLVLAFKNIKVIPVEHFEQAVVENFPNIWPIPQIPASVIEPNIPSSKKAEQLINLYTSMLNIKEVLECINSKNSEFLALNISIMIKVSCLLCGWKGALIDIPLMRKWLKEYNTEMRNNPKLKKNKAYQQKFRDLAEVYEAVLDDDRIHPRYFMIEQGRSYAEDPHYQSFVKTPPKSARSLIIAPKGLHIYHSDASAANLHPLAEIWRSEYKTDPRASNLAKDLEDPFDIHFRTGLYIFYPSKFTEVKNLIQTGMNWKDAAKRLNISDYAEIRKVGKDINFAIPNGSSLATIQSSARGRGYQLSEIDYNRFRNAYNTRYPIELWLSGYERYPIARTLRGRSALMDRQPTWSSFRIQGTIADLFGTGIFETALKEEIYPSLWMHDAVLYEEKDINIVHRAIKHFENIAREWFPTTTMRFETEDFGNRWQELVK